MQRSFRLSARTMLAAAVVGGFSAAQATAGGTHINLHWCAGPAVTGPDESAADHIRVSGVGCSKARQLIRRRLRLDPGSNRLEVIDGFRFSPADGYAYVVASGPLNKEIQYRSQFTGCC
jgi:hypothetical protein